MRFQENDCAAKAEQMNTFVPVWRQFFDKYQEKTGITVLSSETDIENWLDPYILGEIVDKVTNRKEYYYQFHNMEVSEFKETAFYAYWIMKLQPVCTAAAKLSDPRFAAQINEEFAFYYILNSLGNIAKTKGDNFCSSRISVRLYDEMIYTFRYRDVSKEAMMMIVELLYYSVTPYAKADETAVPSETPAVDTPAVDTPAVDVPK